jgi:DNA-binding transcriptional MerR regulator
MPLQRPHLRIGELARLNSLSPDTLRHYERLGLLSAARTPGRFREYGRDAVQRVRVIQAALAIGFTLAELSEILAERTAGGAPCQRVRKLAAAKLDALTKRIEELSRLRRQLERTLAGWDTQLAGTAAGAPARLLDSLASQPRPQRTAARRDPSWQSPSPRGRR